MPTTTGITWYIDGYDQALASATAHHNTTNIPVLICAAPVDGIVRHIQTIGGTVNKRRSKQ